MKRKVIKLGPLCSYIRFISAKSDIEIVGYFIGSELEDVILVSSVIMARNIAKNPKLEFLADPHDILISHAVSDNYNLDVIGILHNHLSGSCKPSEKDLNNMKIWPLVWIISSSRCIRAFRLKEGKLTEHMIEC